VTSRASVTDKTFTEALEVNVADGRIRDLSCYNFFMQKTALVINPWVSDFKLYDEWMHPLGLYFLISLLVYNGYEVRYFNCLERSRPLKHRRYNTGEFPSREIPKPPVYALLKRKYKLYGQSETALADFLNTGQAPQVIFMGSAMTYWMPGLIETVRSVHHVFPKIPLVVGGISAQLIPQTLKSNLPGAIVFQGSLFDSASLKNSGVTALAQLSTKSWTPTLLDAFHVGATPIHGPILTSLGCPCSCSYCASHTLQPSYCIRDRELVVKEMTCLAARYGVEHFAIFDDALLHAPEKNIIPFLTAIISQKLAVSIHTPNGLHVRGVSIELLKLMKEAGFKTLRFGYETGSSRFARDTGAKATRADLETTMGKALQAGFKAADMGVYVMAGLFDQTPAETLDEIYSIASFSVTVKPVFLSPVPGTDLFLRYARRYPPIATDPLWHNDSFFITQLPGWSAETAQEIIDAAKECNARLQAGS